MALAASAQAVTLDDGDYAYMRHGTTLAVVYPQHFGWRDLYANRQSQTKVLVTVGHFLDKDIQLLVSYGQDVSIRSAIKEDARLNLRLLKLFGR